MNNPLPNSRYDREPAAALPPAIDEAVVESLRELQMEGEADLLGELIDLFALDAPQGFEAMRAAITADDADALRRSAHTLKGSSGNMGALVLADLCKQLEDLGRSGAVRGAGELVDRAETEYLRVLAALEAQRANVSA